MILSSLILEILVALIMAMIVAYSIYIGRREKLHRERGFRLILGGFCLLFFGTLVDISDHFPALSRFGFLGRTPLQSLTEKVVGFLAGFLLLAIGLRRWLPHVVARRRTEAERLEQTRRQHAQAAAALQRSEALLETVVASSPIILLAADREERITLARGSALGKIASHPEDLIGRPLLDVLAVRRDDFTSALAGEETAETVRRDGRVFRLRISPWRDDRGRIVGVITLAVDITELERAEVELRQAKERAEEASLAKSRFLATMSHELRTPLNSVIGFAAVLQRPNGRLGGKELRYVERIRENGEHLLHLIDEILDLTKIESGTVSTTLEPLDLVDLITETLREMQDFETDAVRLVTELPAAAGITSDRLKLKQVLINLLANAFKFTERGTVTVRVVTDGDGAARAIEVADTGIGIPADRLETIFEAFRQLDAGSARRYGGAGLGLSISSSLCQLLGFELEAESTMGEGSIFRVVLAPAPFETRSRRRSSKTPGRRQEMVS